MRNTLNFLARLPHPSKQTVLLILVVAATTLLLSTLVSIWLSNFDNLHVPSIGTIHTLDVEAFGGDIEVENETAYVDWGTIYPGTVTNRSFYVRSICNVDARLSLNTTNWTPAEISVYMNLSWNYNETLISPGDTIPVTLTLSASSDNLFIDYLIANGVKDFSFDIIISASEEY